MGRLLLDAVEILAVLLAGRWVLASLRGSFRSGQETDPGGLAQARSRAAALRAQSNWAMIDNMGLRT